MGKKINNICYALIYQIVFVALGGYFSMISYDKIINSTSGIFVSSPGRAIGLVLIIILNIGAIYLVSNFFKSILKLPNIYHIITSVITVSIFLASLAYFKHVELVNCKLAESDSCISAMTTTKFIVTILVLLVFYDVLYLVMSTIAEKRKRNKMIDNKSNK